MHIVETGTPVTVGGLTVCSGDLLHGDLHGIQTVPFPLVAKIPPAAAAIAMRERAVIEQCRASDVTLAKLRSAVGQAGS